MAEDQTNTNSSTPASEAAATQTTEQAATDALNAATKATAAISAETGSGGGAAGSRPLNLPDFGTNNGKSGATPAALGLLDDVTLNVKIELGRTRMYVEDVLRLNENSVVELDKAAGDPVDIFVNDRHVARGEVLVLNENFCVRVSEIIQPVGTDD